MKNPPFVEYIYIYIYFLLEKIISFAILGYLECIIINIIPEHGGFGLGK